MSHKWTKKLENGALNAFSIVVTIMPLLSAFYFMQTQFFNDPRRTTDLQVISKPADPKLYQEPLVSVTFDDGWESIYTEAAPLFEKYNIRTTQYLITSEFDSINYVSLDQARSLKDAGHEIMSHTVSHPDLTTLDRATSSYELSESKKYLQNSDLSDGSIHFAAPRSAVNESVMEQIAKNYASHRNTYADFSNGINELDVNTIDSEIDRYQIIGYSISNETEIDDINRALDYARSHNGWLVLVYHQIDDSESKYAIDTKTLDKHLKLIKSSQIKVAPLGQVVDRNLGVL